MNNNFILPRIDGAFSLCTGRENGCMGCTVNDAKPRILINVIDLADKDRGVQVWEASTKAFAELLKKKITNQDDDEEFDAAFGNK